MEQRRFGNGFLMAGRSALAGASVSRAMVVKFGQIGNDQVSLSSFSWTGTQPFGPDESVTISGIGNSTDLTDVFQLYLVVDHDTTSLVTLSDKLDAGTSFSHTFSPSAFVASDIRSVHKLTFYLCNTSGGLSQGESVSWTIQSRTPTASRTPPISGWSDFDPSAKFCVSERFAESSAPSLSVPLDPARGPPLPNCVSLRPRLG
jgi:hypothetical protein